MFLFNYSGLLNFCHVLCAIPLHVYVFYVYLYILCNIHTSVVPRMPTNVNVYTIPNPLHLTHVNILYEYIKFLFSFILFFCNKYDKLLHILHTGSTLRCHFLAGEGHKMWPVLLWPCPRRQHEDKLSYKRTFV